MTMTAISTMPTMLYIAAVAQSDLTSEVYIESKHDERFLEHSHESQQLFTMNL